jgi:lipoate synthase
MKKIIFIFVCLFLLYSLYSDYRDKSIIQNNYLKLDSSVKRLKSNNVMLTNVIKEDIKNDSLISDIEKIKSKDTIFVKIINPDFKIKLSKEDMTFISDVISSKLNKDSSKIVIINPQQKKSKSRKWFRR